MLAGTLAGLSIFGTALVGVGVAASPATAQPAPGGDERPVVYMTFDDGPDTASTSQVLDTFARYGARATFFVVGSRVNGNPAVARRIVADGHAIANHTYTHPRLTQLSSSAVYDQFVATNRAIEAQTGVRPTCYRPPYGLVNASVHDQAVKAGLPNEGWTTGFGGQPNHWGLWDVDTNDWRRGHERTWAALSSVSGGDVVLLHSITSFSAQIVDQWMAQNNARFRFEALPGCGANLPEPVEPAVPADPANWYRYKVARLYVAYFGRRPDAEGIAFWNRVYVDEVRFGDPLPKIATAFAQSAEFRRRYPNVDDGAFVDLVYHNVMRRDPDAEGYTYWLRLLSSGAVGRGSLLVQFSESPEFIRRSAPVVTGEAWNGDVASSYRRGVELEVVPGPQGGATDE